MKREFSVTAKFKISGNDIPDFISEEHIISNLKSSIGNAVGEIELSSEWYDDSEDDSVWSLFLYDDINIELNEYSVNYSSEPFCEHCGERWTDFAAEINYGGTSWCLNCFETEGILTEEEIKEISKEQKRLKKEFYQQRLDSLKNDDDENDDE